MRWLRQREWPWWQAGLLLGLLNMFAFYTANYYLSISTTFSRAAGMILQVFAPGHVVANAYYKMVKPIVDWQFMLVIGVFIGAYLSARLSREFKIVLELPPLWESRFGTRASRRWVIGLLGGIFVGFGARFADG
ncbi:MAG: YeeE/YedE family protein [candidate division NC10 bacterium]|nr:YeeE/YedE family protein [candidate division NC10 bacterium]